MFEFVFSLEYTQGTLKASKLIYALLCSLFIVKYMKLLCSLVCRDCDEKTIGLAAA